MNLCVERLNGITSIPAVCDGEGGGNEREEGEGSGGERERREEGKRGEGKEGG